MPFSTVQTLTNTLTGVTSSSAASLAPRDEAQYHTDCRNLFAQSMGARL